MVRLDQKWDKLYGVYRGKMEMYRELESMLHRLRNQKSSNLPATRTWLAALYHLFLTVIRRYRLQATPGSFSTSERNLRDAVFLYGCDIDMRKAAMEAMNYKMQWVDAHRLYQKRIYERAGSYDESVYCEPEAPYFSPDSSPDTTSREWQYQHEQLDKGRTMRALQATTVENSDYESSDEGSDGASSVENAIPSSIGSPLGAPSIESTSARDIKLIDLSIAANNGQTNRDPEMRMISRQEVALIQAISAESKMPRASTQTDWQDCSCPHRMLMLKAGGISCKLCRGFVPRPAYACTKCSSFFCSRCSRRMQLGLPAQGGS